MRLLLFSLGLICKRQARALLPPFLFSFRAWASSLCLLRLRRSHSLLPRFWRHEEERGGGGGDLTHFHPAGNSFLPPPSFSWRKRGISLLLLLSLSHS